MVKGGRNGKGGKDATDQRALRALRRLQGVPPLEKGEPVATARRIDDATLKALKQNSLERAAVDGGESSEIGEHKRRTGSASRRRAEATVAILNAAASGEASGAASGAATGTASGEAAMTEEPPTGGEVLISTSVRCQADVDATPSEPSVVQQEFSPIQNPPAPIEVHSKDLGTPDIEATPSREEPDKGGDTPDISTVVPVAGESRNVAFPLRSAAVVEATNALFVAVNGPQDRIRSEEHAEEALARVFAKVCVDREVHNVPLGAIDIVAQIARSRIDTFCRACRVVYGPLELKGAVDDTTIGDVARSVAAPLLGVFKMDSQGLIEGVASENSYAAIRKLLDRPAGPRPISLPIDGGSAVPLAPSRLSRAPAAPVKANSTSLGSHITTHIGTNLSSHMSSHMGSNIVSHMNSHMGSYAAGNVATVSHDVRRAPPRALAFQASIAAQPVFQANASPLMPHYSPLHGGRTQQPVPQRPSATFQIRTSNNLPRRTGLSLAYPSARSDDDFIERFAQERQEEARLALGRRYTQESERLASSSKRAKVESPGSHPLRPSPEAGAPPSLATTDQPNEKLKVAVAPRAAPTELAACPPQADATPSPHSVVTPSITCPLNSSLVEVAPSINAVDQLLEFVVREGITSPLSTTQKYKDTASLFNLDRLTTTGQRRAQTELPPSPPGSEKRNSDQGVAGL